MKSIRALFHISSSSVVGIIFRSEGREERQRPDRQEPASRDPSKAHSESSEQRSCALLVRTSLPATPFSSKEGGMGSISTFGAAALQEREWVGERCAGCPSVHLSSTQTETVQDSEHVSRGLLQREMVRAARIVLSLSTCQQQDRFYLRFTLYGYNSPCSTFHGYTM